MQFYDFTIGPSGSRQLDAVGNYFRYDLGNAGGADATVRLRGVSSGMQILLRPGQAFNTPDDKGETSWVVSNYAGTGTIVGVVTIGRGKITDNRISGEVSVTDGEGAKSKAGLAFIAYSAQGAAAGQGGYLEVWNPPGSGRRLVMSDVLWSSTTFASVGINRLTSTLGAAASALSKSSAAASGAVAKVGQGTLATFAGSGLEVALVFTPAPFARTYKQPLIAEPGTGWLIFCQTFNTAIYISTQFTEEAI